MKSESEKAAGKSIYNTLTRGLLKTMALLYNRRPSLREYLRWDGGWLDLTVGLRTESGSVEQAIRFREGKATVLGAIPDDADSLLLFADEEALRLMITRPPSELFNLLMKNRVIPQGNLASLQLFNFLISVLLRKKHIRQLRKEARREKARPAAEPVQAQPKRTESSLKAPGKDRGVMFLKDCYLPEYSLEDFPRLKEFLRIHFTEKPALCAERPEILTRFFRENGYETDPEGRPWSPVLRQARAFRYLMEQKKPLIRRGDLIAGTTTTKEIGVVLYPDAHGTMIWGELFTVPYRLLNPYDTDEETVRVLHKSVFPYWIHRNFREWVREKRDYPVAQRLDERFAVYFLWKTVALSHTILDYPRLLKKGTTGIIGDIDKELKKKGADREKRETLQAMKIALEGINLYAAHLSEEAARQAERESDPSRRDELKRLAEICARVPAGPARTLDEAVNALWIVWVGTHMENTNAGFSLGRLDQWLQPYFAADMKKLRGRQKRESFLRHAIELIGCFYMRCTDHLPLVPDIGNYLFGGSSSDQAITLGGVTPDGKDAVNDMTYIFLKVTEMLKIRDPNVNARYHPEKNSDLYLRRLCEVNVRTTATPSIHNDAAVMNSLKEFRYPDRHLRDWSATGCVEPTLSGRHLGHTNCMMFNMVAALEMALNDGRHPLMRWNVGPRTGLPEAGTFASFEEFYRAFCRQFDLLAEMSCTYNNLLGEAHQALRPTPFISALIEGTIPGGRDVTRGGARYNSSGTACIGLADVTDSLMAVKRLVYDEKRLTFGDLMEAVRSNFAVRPEILALIKSRVPKFGSGDPEAVALANRITGFAHDCFGKRKNYRGGRYTAGFWSMSNHVAFGTLTGALPSGRPAGKPFTPGLTPEPDASRSLLDNIRDVSRLEAAHMNNNIAFNVKVVPGARETHADTVEHVFQYARTYNELGGMQMQLNVVSSATLRDAMAHPENYQDLLVRISGYNAYFVTLNRDMQMELIERAEFGI